MRRAILRLVHVSAVAALVLPALALRPTAVQPAKPANYRDVAIDAAKWIRSSRVDTLFGYAWPSDPSDPKTISTALYSGSPGVVLFLLELHAATGDPAYLAEARRGADELMTKV